jgi:hypothetical protein
LESSLLRSFIWFEDGSVKVEDRAVADVIAQQQRTKQAVAKILKMVLMIFDKSSKIKIS